MQTELEPAYILHARPYRDTSLLVNFFSLHYGRMSCVVRGVRKSKSPKRNLLNPFQPLLISFQGNHDLKLLTQFESAEVSTPLEGRFLLSGFYLNELMMRLLPEQDAHESVFYNYEQCVKSLAQRSTIESVLRKFELELLRDLGYAVSFETDASSLNAINAKENYYLNIHEGFFASDLIDSQNNSMALQLKRQGFFRGEDILAIGQGALTDPQVLAAAKKITRLLMHPLLGDKPLVSRELFAHCGVFSSKPNA